jgi:predicted transcriptional regulator YdeE
LITWFAILPKAIPVKLREASVPSARYTKQEEKEPTIHMASSTIYSVWLQSIPSQHT